MSAIVLLNAIVAFALYSINIAMKLELGQRLATITVVVVLLFIVGSATLLVHRSAPQEKMNPVKVSKVDKKDILLFALLDRLFSLRQMSIRL